MIQVSVALSLSFGHYDMNCQGPMLGIIAISTLSGLCGMLYGKHSNAKRILYNYIQSKFNVTWIKNFVMKYLHSEKLNLSSTRLELIIFRQGTFIIKY